MKTFKRVMGLIFRLLAIILVFLSISELPSQNNSKNAQKRYAIMSEELGATQLTDFNTWTRNNLGGVTVYSPYCIRIYSDGGATWSYLWTTITFNARSIVNYNFHVTAENSNLRTGIRIYNPSTNTDYVNITETLTSPKTYQGSLIFQNAETIRFDLRRNYYGTGYSGGCVWSVSLAYSDYNTGYTDGYDEGFDFGLDNGYNEGVDAVLNSPDDYDLYTEIQYDANYDNGVDAVISNPNSYDLYTQTQYDKNFQDGYDDGYVDGYNEGDADGYDVGFDDGYSQGESAGFTEGVQKGYETGYVDGEDDGYYNGFEAAKSQITGLVWVEETLKATQRFLDLSFFPGITLGHLVGGILIVELVIWFIRWWR